MTTGRRIQKLPLIRQSHRCRNETISQRDKAIGGKAFAQEIGILRNRDL